MRVSSVTRFRVGAVCVLLLLLMFPSCRQTSVDFGTIQGFADLKAALLQGDHDGYQVLEVINEGLVLRVNVAPEVVPEDRFQTRVQATNILYDVQTIAGKELSVSVWLYRSNQAEKSQLLGMAFYHALTEQVVFKTPEELP